MLKTIMSLLGSKVGLAIAGALVGLLLTCAGLIWYLRSENNTLLQQNVGLRVAVESQNKAIESIKNDLALEKEVVTELQRAYRISQRKLEELRNSVSGIQELIIDDPKAAEDLANEITNNLFLCIQINTGLSSEELGMTIEEYNNAKTNCNK